ncbi:MAG: single-stranded DNA-binding protein [Treponema sp.]
MTDINHVVLVGRLTRDMEVRSTNTAVPIGRLSLAVNRSRKNGEQWVEEANFFDVTLMGNIVDRLKTYLIKGKQIGIDGSLRQDRWEKDGQKFSKVVIMANNIQLLGGGGNGSGNASQGYAPRQSYTPNNSAPQQNVDSMPEDNQSFGGDDGNFSEDIPF